MRRIVLIQMSYFGSDNSYMLDMMAKYPGAFSGVAIVDENADPSGREESAELARRGARGFRIVAGNQPPDRWLVGRP